MTTNNHFRNAALTIDDLVVMQNALEAYRDQLSEADEDWPTLVALIDAVENRQEDRIAAMRRQRGIV